ncbi:hypothetical protein GOP47_0015323 [Adiantum capillus-veneris]|uniref:Uncharacterized protein n=1 Tax=Adiantum capillus-veneris TaxID=13818 RepID=A0A9D4ZCJ7_ADICA|nr:hypothetical protein GOP47_0015323 [Adiantum capillus-veneris]
MHFYKLKKKDDESLVAHLNKFTTLKQHLLGVQKQIPSDEAIAVLLNSVDKAPFDILVSTLQNIEKNIDEVIAALMEFDSKQRNAVDGVALPERNRLFFNQGGFKGGRMMRGRDRDQGGGRGHHLPQMWKANIFFL